MVAFFKTLLSCYTGPHVANGCPGSTHYRPNCNGGTVTTTTPVPTTTIFLPPGTVCEGNRETRYVLIEGTLFVNEEHKQKSSTGVALNDANAVEFQSRSLQECLQACTNNRLPDGRQAVCQSVDYRAGSCRLNTNTLRPEGSGTPTPSAGNSFYEKICVTPSNNRQCPGPYLLTLNVGFGVHLTSLALKIAVGSCRLRTGGYTNAHLRGMHAAVCQ